MNLVIGALVPLSLAAFYRILPKPILGLTPILLGQLGEVVRSGKMKGATGRPVALLMQFLLNRAKCQR